MARGGPDRIIPGASVLGGAAFGLSYEGATRDALAYDLRRPKAPPAPPPRATPRKASDVEQPRAAES
jgi:hypothetical protein